MLGYCHSPLNRHRTCWLFFAGVHSVGIQPSDDEFICGPDPLLLLRGLATTICGLVAGLGAGLRASLGAGLGAIGGVGATTTLLDAKGALRPFLTHQIVQVSVCFCGLRTPSFVVVRHVA
jgi:hypothetical protein